MTFLTALIHVSTGGTGFIETKPATLSGCLESGAGGGQYQLGDIERRFAGQTLACAYDRAGVGNSDPPAHTPRPVSEIVADLDGFAAAAARPPYLLVGQSMGGNVVLMYAQEDDYGRPVPLSATAVAADLSPVDAGGHIAAG